MRGKEEKEGKEEEENRKKRKWEIRKRKKMGKDSIKKGTFKSTRHQDI